MPCYEPGAGAAGAGLAAGDPGGEVVAAWQGKELLGAVSAASDLTDARAALERLLPLGRRRRGGGAVAARPHGQVWEAKILAFQATDGCSNRPTEAVNLLVKKVKGVGHGFGNFATYRLGLLVPCGVRWQTHQVTRLRGHAAALVSR